MRLVLLLLLTVYTLFAMKLEDIKSFEADFKQVITNPSGKVIEYRGKVFIKEPNKILWKYQEPIIKSVYINGDFAIIDEPELEQAIYTSLEKEINLLKLIKNAKQISPTKYEAKLLGTVYNIEVENNEFKRIVYKDELENNITINFESQVTNADLPNYIFSFRVPDHYDIIRK